MQGGPANLTMPGKSAVMKGNLFDKQTAKSNWLSRRALNGLQGVRSVRKRLAAGKNNKNAANPPAPIGAVVLLLGLVFVLGFRCFAQDSPPTEYQIKAAFLYNFAKFVEWPTQALGQATSPVVIGVLGENVFDGDLERTIHGKTINGHPLQFQEFHSAAEAVNCHVLFISASEQGRFPKILAGLRGRGVLTVSESARF